MLSKIESGQRIRKARQDKGWSQQRLADEIGSGRRHVIRWENGENMPGSRYRRLLTDSLGVDFSELDEEEDMAEMLRLLGALEEIRQRRLNGTVAA